MISDRFARFIYVLVFLIYLYIRYICHTLQVVEYQSGRTKMLGYFIGEVMHRTGRRGDPSVIKQLLLNKLSKQ